MGYESRFYAVLPFEFYPGLEKVRTSQVLALIDVSKAGYTTQTGKLIAESVAAHNTSKAVPYGFYEDDGNTLVVEDRYEDKLSPVDLDTLIAALEQDIAARGENPYRRFVTALALFTALRSHRKQYPNLVILHYGY